MRDGHPDRDAFQAVIGSLTDRVVTRVGGDHARVAVFGELVALLAADGHHAAVIDLEHMWNDLLQTRPFRLLCAYPLGVFPRSGDGEAFGAICASHSRVVPTEDYTVLTDDAARLQNIAFLQQRARALESEIAEREAPRRCYEPGSGVADFAEQVPIPLHWVGEDGAILWANRAELTLLGYSREEYIGRHIASFYVDQE